jgi:hypothetical protein
MFFFHIELLKNGVHPGAFQPWISLRSIFGTVNCKLLQVVIKVKPTSHEKIQSWKSFDAHDIFESFTDHM